MADIYMKNTCFKQAQSIGVVEYADCISAEG